MSLIFASFLFLTFLQQTVFAAFVSSLVVCGGSFSCASLVNGGLVVSSGFDFDFERSVFETNQINTIDCVVPMDDHRRQPNVRSVGEMVPGRYVSHRCWFAYVRADFRTTPRLCEAGVSDVVGADEIYRART